MLGVTGHRARRRTPTGRGLIRSTDFTYLGSMKLTNLYPIGVDDSRGLTHRYRGGVMRLLSFGETGELIEWTPATLKTSAPYNDCPGVSYGHILSGKNQWPDPVIYLLPRSLLWDETKQKLYWTILDQYTGLSSAVSIGRATLNDAGPSGSSVGRFGTALGYKRVKGILPIPAPAVAEIGGNRRFGIGFGGYESLVTNGPASMGPALCAFNPDDLDALSEGQSLSGAQCTILCDHPYHNTPYNNPVRARRNQNYKQGYDGWHPNAGSGYWTWSDDVQQSAIWIDDGEKHGAIWFVRQMTGSETATVDSGFTPVSHGSNEWTVRVAAPLANSRNGDHIWYPGLQSATIVTGGNTTEMRLRGYPTGTNPTPTPSNSGTTYRGSWYYDSKGWCTQGQLAAFFYNPADLIAQNTNPLPYYEEATWAVPQVSTPFASWDNVGRNIVRGCTYDPLTKRLYLLFSLHYRPSGDTFDRALISVYQLG